jgi:hypothetical protein
MVEARSSRDIAPVTISAPPGGALRDSRLPPMSALEQPLAGRYFVENRLGRAPDGELMRVHELGAQGRHLVMKRSQSPRPDSAELFASVMVEAAVRQKLLDHPLFVKIHGWGTWEGSVVVLRELIKGRSLYALRSAGALPPLPAGPLLFLGLQLADGLAAAHEAQRPDGRPAGLVHGRLTPSDILVESDGQVTLTELSLGRLAPGFPLPSSATEAWRCPYLAPELIAGVALDEASDRWGLGRLLLDLASPAALGAMSEEDLAAAIRALGAARKDLPAAFFALLARLTRTDPARRPSSTRQVAAELASMASEFGDRVDLEFALRDHLRAAMAVHRPPVERPDVERGSYAPMALEEAPELELQHRERGPVGALRWMRGDLVPGTGAVGGLKSAAAVAAELRIHGRENRRRKARLRALAVLCFVVLGAAIARAVHVWPGG